MRRSIILLTALLFVLCLGISSVAEEITLTTYYPAPYGAYKEFTTTEKTCLATSSGNVGIGTTAPGALLDVRGTIYVNNPDAANITSGDIVLDSGNAIQSNTGANNFYARIIPFTGTGNTEFRNYYTSASNGEFRFFTANLVLGSQTQVMTINRTGDVGIGITNPSYKLDVAGDINTTGDIRKSGIAYMNPDYVFETGYKLMPLTELKGYLEINKHLPNLPSTEEIKKEGVKMFEQNRLILEKLEEAYLYIIELEQRIKKLEGR